MDSVNDEKRWGLEMAVSVSELALVAIAVALWVWVLFGANLV